MSIIAEDLNISGTVPTNEQSRIVFFASDIQTSNIEEGNPNTQHQRLFCNTLNQLTYTCRH